MANLSKEDIELFTQSAATQQQMQQQFYQPAYNFTCDSLQSTPEHQLYNGNNQVQGNFGQQNDMLVQSRSQQMMQQQQFLLSQQQEQQFMPDSTSYYLNCSGSGHMLIAAAPIQPYFIQNDLNNSKVKTSPVNNMPHKSSAGQLLHNSASITEREMTPDSIDENVNELVLNTKKVRLFFFSFFYLFVDLKVKSNFWFYISRSLI